jgi:hypothetical protein
MGLSQFRGGGMLGQDGHGMRRMVGSGTGGMSRMVGCGTGGDGTGAGMEGGGIISGLNIPVISGLAGLFGLGKGEGGRRRRKHNRQEAMAMGHALGKHIHQLHGGGFWDDFKSGFNSVISPIAKVAKVALPFIAPGVGSMASAGLGALGYGRHSRYDRRRTGCGKMRGGAIPQYLHSAVDSLKQMAQRFVNTEKGFSPQQFWTMPWHNLMFDEDLKHLFTYLANEGRPEHEHMSQDEVMDVIQGDDEHAHYLKQEIKHKLYSTPLNGRGKLVITHGGGRERDDVAMMSGGMEGGQSFANPSSMAMSGAYQGQGYEGGDGTGAGMNGGGIISGLNIPVISGLAGLFGLGKGEGGRRKRASAGPNDGRRKRAEVVKKVMAERGISMIEASKYVKAHGLY